MGYLIILLADLFLAGGFVFQKIFQQKKGNSLSTGLLFNGIAGLFSAISFVFISGFKIGAEPYSIVMATAQTILVTAYTLISFKILEEGNLSLYTLFLMTGGMTLPYLYGVLFLDEKLSPLRCVGLIFIIAAVVMSNADIKKTSQKQILLCVFVFFLNGMVSIVSKIHQIETVYKTVDSASFAFWTSAIKLIICVPIYMFVKKGTESICDLKDIKITIIILLSALTGGVSYLLQLIGAKDIPATVLYPLVTGGSIIMCALAGFVVFKEKPTKLQTVGIAVCFAGTCMFI